MNTFKKFSLFLPLLVLLFSVQSSFGQTQDEKDRAAFLRNTRVLEKIPLDPNAEAARNWNFKWLTETEDVTITVCGDSLDLFPKKNKKVNGALGMQILFGTAVYKLNNPDKKDDEKSALLAGIESALRSYEAMIDKNPKIKNKKIDALIEKRDKGELKDFVDKFGCFKK